MHVFELIWPGTRLSESDSFGGDKFTVERLMYGLESALIEVAIALAAYEQARDIGRIQQRANSPEEWELRRSLEASLEAELSVTMTDEERWDAKEEIQFLAEASVLRQRFRSGVVPADYVHRAPLLFAKAFVYALDSTGKMLSPLAKTPGAPVVVSDHREMFYTALPRLTAVRDSSHHHEERIQGLQRGKPIDLQPVETRGLSASAGTLVLDNLVDDCFGTVLANGQYGEVEVDAASAAVAQRAIQGVANAFAWTGPERYTPSR